MNTNEQNILWIDCIGGLLVGVIVLVACQLLSSWENLPLSIVVGMGLANLLYGLFSLYVTKHASRPIHLVVILACANMSWLLVCISITLSCWQTISGLGILHVMGEGVYVALLGYTEWRWRKSLSGS